MTVTPVSNDYGPQRRRRLQVIAMYGGFALACAGLWMAFSFPPQSAVRYAGYALTVLALFIVGTPLIALMRNTFINAPHVVESALDERQRQLRDRAFRASYLILSTFALLQAIYVMIASSWKDASALIVPNGIAQIYFWGVFLLSLTLPTAILAWTTPDPLPAED